MHRLKCVSEGDPLLKLLILLKRGRPQYLQPIFFLKALAGPVVLIHGHLDQKSLFISNLNGFA